MRHEFYTQHRNRLDQNLSKIMKIYFIPFYLKGNPKYCTKIFGVKFCLQKWKNNIFAENFLWLGNSVKTGNFTFVWFFISMTIKMNIVYKIKLNTCSYKSYLWYLHNLYLLLDTWLNFSNMSQNFWCTLYIFKSSRKCGENKNVNNINK